MKNTNARPLAAWEIANHKAAVAARKRSHALNPVELVGERTSCCAITFTAQAKAWVPCDCTYCHASDAPAGS